MAEEEPILANPATQQDARHVSDYSRFTAMMKWGAIVTFAIGIILLLFIL